MRIFVNGLEREVPAPQTIDTLLRLTGHAGRRVAVEINREIVPRSGHASRALVEDDRVELIQAIGGG